ncbi:MAG: hypothetical protein PHO70_07670 [Candidatus Omnitrophica bacterium]|nr:hypothetical protein [Candidatus Omnitrophota bacterium]
MKKLFGLVALLAMVLSFSSVYADVDLWGDYTGPVTLKFSGFTNGTIYSPTSAPNFDTIEDGWGVGRVTSVSEGFSGSGNPLWAFGPTSTSEVTYYYHDIVDYAVGDLPGQILSKGGVFDFYLNPAGSFNNINAADRATGFTQITGGTPLMRAFLVPGILFPDDTTTTIEQSLFPVNGGGVMGNGTALAAIDLTGVWDTALARAINSNVFANNADLRLGFTISPNTADNGFMLVHNDPANAVVTPEPISSALFLLGGAALVGGRLKKKNRKA